MTKNEILKELNRAFQDFKFYEDGHYYEYKDKRVGISATRLIEEYANEFNQEAIAEKVAIKENKTVQQVLDEWEYKNKFACAKGSVCHEFVQHLWSGNEWLWSGFGRDEYEEETFYHTCDLIFDQAYNFYDDYKDRLKHVADEFVIGSSEYDIASAVDHLFINKLTGGLVLVDYKTNSYLTGYNKKAYSKPMKIPLHELNDDSLHHYYIQLSMYKFIIEKYTNLKVDEMFIVYMSENIDNYEIINIPYLEKEVEEILERRIWLD